MNPIAIEPPVNDRARCCFHRVALFALLVGAAILAAHRAHADPWASPGEIGVRNDIEILVDSGVIDIPVTTWPIPWGAVAHALKRVHPKTLTPLELEAYVRLESHIERVQSGGNHVGYAAALAPGRPSLNWFGQTTRGKEMAAVSDNGTDGILAYRFNVEGVLGSRDHQRGRFDGSYLALALGNWIVSGGEVNDWWGPGWGGSLILGDNSRPPLGVSLTRNVPYRFRTPWLSWLGPWTITFFNDRLDQGPPITHPWLFGERFAFRPFPNLEIGLSRTAIWGGASEPHGLSGFSQILFFHRTGYGSLIGDNRAGLDFRWTFSVGGQPFTLYNQDIAEGLAHELGGLLFLHDFMGQVGLSTWGPVGADGGSYRVFAEYTNTTTGFLSEQGLFYNVAYESGIYLGGYRYRGLVLGYPTDNDSELWTGGVLFEGLGGGTLTFLARHGTLNLGNTQVVSPVGNTYAPVRTAFDEFDVYFRPSFWHRALELGLGVTRWAPTGFPVEIGPDAFIGWRVNFHE